MTMYHLSKLGLCLTLALGLGACSQQSSYQRQDLALADHWQQPDDGLTRQQAGPWWQGFHDPELDRLIEAVLAANPDMQVAGLRLRSALLGADLADTNLTPSVNAGISGNGTKDLNRARRWSSTGSWPISARPSPSASSSSPTMSAPSS